MRCDEVEALPPGAFKLPGTRAARPAGGVELSFVCLPTTATQQRPLTRADNQTDPIPACLCLRVSGERHRGRRERFSPRFNLLEGVYP